ncbi:hypothetical protein K438DRAFT_1759538 [Mycena galopus ATCC 62051]|nr:hypothetical protein K438DRAFT_1759538 [Mycena galopus ATCC 62051]
MDSQNIDTLSPSQNNNTPSLSCLTKLPRIGLTDKIANTVELVGATGLKAMLQELCHKMTITNDILNTREALAAVIRSLVAEATAQVKTREAELKLALLRETEAHHRVEYYCCLSEVVKEEVGNTELQAAMLRLQGRKIGVEGSNGITSVKGPPPIAHCLFKKEFTKKANKPYYLKGLVLCDKLQNLPVRWEHSRQQWNNWARKIHLRHPTTNKVQPAKDDEMDLAESEEEAEVDAARVEVNVAGPVG